MTNLLLARSPGALETWADTIPQDKRVPADPPPDEWKIYISTSAHPQTTTLTGGSVESVPSPELASAGLVFRSVPSPIRGAVRQGVVWMKAGAPRGFQLAIKPPTAPQGGASAHVSQPVLPEAGSTSFMKHLEHLDYLKRASTEGKPPGITEQTARLARVAWQVVWKASEFRMPVPASCTGPDGQMFYSWDAGRHHLELEIIPGKPAEFFYRDRESGELWGEDYQIGQSLSAGAVERLKLFA